MLFVSAACSLASGPWTPQKDLEPQTPPPATPTNRNLKPLALLQTPRHALRPGGVPSLHPVFPAPPIETHTPVLKFNMFSKFPPQRTNLYKSIGEQCGLYKGFLLGTRKARVCPDPGINHTGLLGEEDLALALRPPCTASSLVGSFEPLFTAAAPFVYREAASYREAGWQRDLGGFPVPGPRAVLPE